MINRETTIAISSLFQVLSLPPRLEILLAIGSGEACVCHLEASLGYRQAYISQHLMVLREAHLLETRRDGRFIYYRLSDARLLELLRQAGALGGVEAKPPPRIIPGCVCPHCANPLVEISASPFDTALPSTPGV